MEELAVTVLMVIGITTVSLQTYSAFNRLTSAQVLIGMASVIEGHISRHLQLDSITTRITMGGY